MGVSLKLFVVIVRQRNVDYKEICLTATYNNHYITSQKELDSLQIVVYTYHI